MEGLNIVPDLFLDVFLILDFLEVGVYFPEAFNIFKIRIILFPEAHQ